MERVVKLLLGLLAVSGRVTPAVVPQSSDTIAFTARAPVSASNVSADNVLQISCNAPQYGQNLKVSSCKNVFSMIPKDNKQVTFAERGTSLPYDLPLPYRLQSKDGFCFVQVVLAPGAYSGRASLMEIGTAAITLLEQCVKKYGYGGAASEIGGNNKLEVVFSSYKPHVKCSQRPGPPWQSAVSVFANMDASREMSVFGHAGAPGIQFTLPLRIQAPDARAMIIVDSAGRSATSSWYEIWEAVNAIAYMCVRLQGKGGRATGIGSLSNIRVDLLNEHADSSQFVANTTRTPQLSLVDSMLPLENAQAIPVPAPSSGPASDVTIVQTSGAAVVLPSAALASPLGLGTA